MEKTYIGSLGSFAGIITAAVLQPLQNIKMALIFPPKDTIITKNIMKNLYNAGRYIATNQGLKGFFKGNVPCMLRAGVASFFYFSTLRHLQKYKSQNNKIMNFACSSIARIFSSIISNPINVIQTRFQMINFRGYTSVYDGIIKILKYQGPLTFFKGGLTSCYKQGIFAGFYYMFYEQIKSMGYSRLTAGLISGLLSTTISHPFEIIRAKLQTQGIRQSKIIKQSTLLDELKDLYKNGGWFKGLSPRLLKKPLSNSFAFLIFQRLQNKEQVQ